MDRMSRRARLTLEAPETVVARSEEEEKVQQICIMYKGQVMNGTMTQGTRDVLNEQSWGRELLTMWDSQKAFLEQSRVNQKVKLKKMTQRVWSLLKGVIHIKSGGNDCLSIRPKQLKAFNKQKKLFLKTGFGIGGWEDLVNDVCIRHGCVPMFKDD